MTWLMARHRGVAIMAAGVMAAVVMLWAPPAQADVTGGCEGSVDFSSDDVGPYTPANDTRDNPVVVPKDDGNVANWQGSVPGANTDFSGKVEIRIGPAWIEVADWGFPDHDGTNAEDTRSDDGAYDMDELWDVVPKNIAQGIYEARAVHSADAVDCEAQFFVKFEGNALSSPVVIVALVLAVLFLAMLIVAGRRTASVGFFAGRPVLAVFAALLLALMAALLLQQFCVWPLDTTTVIFLPILLVIVGLVIAKMAPFGGMSPGVAEVAARQARRESGVLDQPATPDPGPPISEPDAGGPDARDADTGDAGPGDDTSADDAVADDAAADEGSTNDGSTEGPDDEGNPFDPGWDVSQPRE